MNRFKNFLEKIRQKDDSQKILISFVFAFLITFVIVSTWWTWSSAKEKTVIKQEQGKKTQDVTPISNLGNQFSEIRSMFGDVLTQFNDSKEILQAIPEIIEEIENSTTTIEIESSVE
jgi:Tfp pilus assembly protein PilO